MCVQLVGRRLDNGLVDQKKEDEGEEAVDGKVCCCCCCGAFEQDDSFLFLVRVTVKHRSGQWQLSVQQKIKRLLVRE